MISLLYSSNVHMMNIILISSAYHAIQDMVSQTSKHLNVNHVGTLLQIQLPTQ